MFSYSTEGVCAKKINFDIIEGKLSNVEFVGGCPGNLIGIKALVEGMEPNDAIKKLKGISCGGKTTSCPDQLALALESVL